MIENNVAVIIPVRNRPKTVLMTLESVANQTSLPSLVIIIDDGSTDSTAHSVQDWIDQQQPATNFELIQKPHSGASAARNRGFQKADGYQYVAFLDSDDLWPADFLERTTALLKDSPKSVAVTCDRKEINTANGKTKFRSHSSLPISPVSWLLKNPPGIGSATLFRSDAIRRLGAYNENTPTGHDLELFLKLSLEGDWLYSPGEPVIYQYGLDACSQGEEGHLSRKYVDRHQIWANIIEDFFENHSNRKDVSKSVFSRKLTDHWFKAARAFLQDGRRENALACIHKSLYWQKLNFKTRFLWLKAIIS